MHPPVRSFRRRGRMTPARKLRWAEFAPRFVISADGIVAWQPTVLDVGFGSGETVLAAAAARPNEHILGIEVHEAGITHLLTSLAAAEVSNVRVVRQDLLDVIDFVPLGSLLEVCIFFPDPWPKAAHVQRRLVRPDVVAMLTDRLTIGGVLRLATDAAHYAIQMSEVCDANDELVAVDPMPRVETKYERLGRAAGRPIADLAYRKEPTR
jgi:tRNA (guanine-N7-)-methyltransferase